MIVTYIAANAASCIRRLYFSTKLKRFNSFILRKMHFPATFINSRSYASYVKQIDIDKVRLPFHYFLFNSIKKSAYSKRNRMLSSIVKINV